MLEVEFPRLSSRGLSTPVSFEDELAVERQQLGEEVFLNFEEMSRCRICRRLVTLSRLLREGSCKCGSRAVAPAGFFFVRDVESVEEEYGWDNVTLTNIRPEQIDDELKPRGFTAATDVGVSPAIELDEARAHSRERSEKNRHNAVLHQLNVGKRWILGIPKALRRSA